jgi:hypothetical protein
MPQRSRAPGKHRPVMMGQGKGRGHMHIPPPGTRRNQPALGGMDLSGAQLNGKTVAITGQAEKGMEAVLAKVAIISHSLPIAVAGSSVESRLMISRLSFFPLSRASVVRVRAPSKASNPMALPKTSFSTLEIIDCPAPTLWPKIDHDRSVKIRPDHLFLASTTIEHCQCQR